MCPYIYVVNNNRLRAPYRKSLCRLSPIPISLDGDQSEDYSGECVSQECFAKCLGLVATTTLHSTPREKLLAEWPLRLLSRSKAYRTNEPKDIKVVHSPYMSGLVRSVGRVFSPQPVPLQSANTVPTTWAGGRTKPFLGLR